MTTTLLNSAAPSAPAAPLRPVPGPAPAKNLLQIIGIVRALKRDLLGYFSAPFATYGDIFAWRFGEHQMQIILSRPEHIREMLVERADDFEKGADYKDTQRGLARFLGNGLLISDGEFWKRQRKLVSPALHARRIERYADDMVAITRQQIAEWEGRSSIHVNDEMMRATLTIVARTLFNADVSGAVARFSMVMEVLQNMMGPGELLPRWVPTLKRLRETRAVRTLDEIVYGIIRERRESGMEDTGDLLSMLLLARDDDDNPMTDRQVRDELVTLFLAGHETTANALNFTWVLLAQNPDVEAKLHHEIDTVLNGRAPTMADLKALPYTEQVFKEVLRLYPPAYSYGRRALRDTQIGGYAIPAGAGVTVFNYYTQRNGEYFPDPERFDPDRFSPEREPEIDRYAYVPFGGGPRVCIGNSFAMMEARLMIATIAQRWKLRLSPGQRVELDPLITLRPRGGLPMLLERR
jgi:cytochrome P450